MDEKMREKVVATFEQVFYFVGSEDYEGGMKKVKRLADLAYLGISSIQTKDGLREFLDSLPPMLPESEEVMLQFTEQLPQLLRTGFEKMAKQAARDLPVAGNGRPQAVTAEQSREIVKYVLDLYGKNGSVGVARNRAALKFGVSRRTVDRIWANRDSHQTDKLTIQQMLSLLLE